MPLWVMDVFGDEEETCCRKWLEEEEEVVVGRSKEARNAWLLLY